MEINQVNNNQGDVNNGTFTVRVKPSEGDQFECSGSDHTVYTVYEVIDPGVLLDSTERIYFVPWTQFMADYRPVVQEDILAWTDVTNAFDRYQQQAKETAIYPANSKVVYPIIGLLSEAGEVAGKLKKLIRDEASNITPEFTQAIAAELGDVLWYVASTCTDLNLSLAQVAQSNLDKLAARSKNDTIKGSGDNR